MPLLSEILEGTADNENAEGTREPAVCTDFESLQVEYYVSFVSLHSEGFGNDRSLFVFQDSSKQFPLYTFNSAGFIKLQAAYDKEESITTELLEEPVELIGVFRENEPYKFQDWYKSTRI